MLLKGNQRGGGRQMALHLLNADQNEHVSVHEVSGFVADDVQGALKEAYALSKATKCKQFMYSLSLNPPQDAKVPIKTFESAIEEAENRLGLEGQPRVVVFHEKEGRRHAHCVWSRINTDEMKAINMSHDHKKLNALSKQLYLENDWKLPEGFIDKSKKSPLNFTRAEWQQALRTGQKAGEIKEALQECWAISDSRKAFEQALGDKGYTLARGDRRGYVAVDVYGEVYSLPRQLSKKAKDLKARLGDPKSLPSVQEAKTTIAGRMGKVFSHYGDEMNLKHEKEKQPLLTQKEAITLEHRKQRAAQQERQEKRWLQEEQRRAARLRKGFKGLWDRLTGSYSRTRKRNETETEKARLRDRLEHEKLIHAQLEKRQELQRQMLALRKSQIQERFQLYRGMNKHYKKLDRQDELKKLLHKQRMEKAKRKDHGFDFDPEI
ncbi:hypothetical protein P886_4161 [Alteromonadaceae bacterium 2753L.S.0a.02]|nr:hypothetical protein P886_4161 [Alteromonadaceae bacterium 2753L.S.0a.02]